MDIVFPANYPYDPPNVTMNTPIFHPNFSYTTTSGSRSSICIDILKKSVEWSPSLSISKGRLFRTDLIFDF